MELKQVLENVKAAAALHSTIATVGDINDDTSLEKVGIQQDQIGDFKTDLYRLLATGLEEPVAFKKFSSSLKIKGTSTVQEIAAIAQGLVVPLPKCSTMVPVPDVPTCQIWMTRSYFCRILRAVKKWADPAAVPPAGITPDLTLGSLVALFDDGQRLRLIQLTNREAAFQPFDVSAGDPGSKKLTGDTTVQGYAKLLWDLFPTGCSIIVDFPAEG